MRQSQILSGKCQATQGIWTICPRTCQPHEWSHQIPSSFFCKRRATESSSCKIQISSKPRQIKESTHSVYGKGNMVRIRRKFKRFQFSINPPILLYQSTFMIRWSSDYQLPNLHHNFGPTPLGIPGKAWLARELFKINTACSRQKRKINNFQRPVLLPRPRGLVKIMPGLRARNGLKIFCAFMMSWKRKKTSEYGFCFLYFFRQIQQMLTLWTTSSLLSNFLGSDHPENKKNTASNVFRTPLQTLFTLTLTLNHGQICWPWHLFKLWRFEASTPKKTKI